MLTTKEDVMEIFEIWSGKKDLKNATPYIPEIQVPLQRKE